MLLQFAVENYLSFRDRAVLSMLADERVPHDPGQVLESADGRKVLRAAAVYGPNGAGKSNLVKALGTFQRIVMTGTRGEESLPLVPFKLDASLRDEPAHFEVELVASGRRFSYGFEATAKRVHAEWLYEIDRDGTEVMLFEREAGEKAPKVAIGDALSADAKRRTFMEFVAEGTRQNQLLLAEAGERNVAELEPIRSAIRSFNVVQPDTLHVTLLDDLERDAEFRKVLGLVLKEGGTGIHDLNVVVEQTKSDLAEFLRNDRFLKEWNQVSARQRETFRLDEQGRPIVVRLQSMHRLPTGEDIALSIHEESDGTRRLLDLAPILHKLDHRDAEALFAVDEIERSLHPLLTRMLLQLFFARAGSGAATQLVFTTHDTNLLDVRVLSRDSIWLMEKDARGGSVMYPLSELDQAQVDEVESQGKGLERGYLQGRFGAIPFFGSLEALGFRKDLIK